MRRNRDKRFLLSVGIFLVVSVLLVFLARIRAARLFLLPDRTWTAMRATASYQTRSKGDEAAREREIVARAFEAVDRLFNPLEGDSPLSRINRTAGVEGAHVQVRAESGLLHVIVFAMRAAKHTSGAYNPAMAPLVEEWVSRGAQGAAPAPGEVAALRPLVAWEHIRISMTGPFARISLDKAGAKIDVDRLARAYAVDLAYSELKESGAKDFLVRLGDNVRVSGNRHKNREGWEIPVKPASPARRRDVPVTLRDGQACCLTGPDERLSPVPASIRPLAVDPRTGAPVREAKDVCVVACNAMTANVYSTAVYVMGEEEGGAFARRERTVAGLVFLDGGGRGNALGKSK